MTDVPSTNQSSYVIARVRGRAGRLTLNRPDALNALTLSMVRDLRFWLDHWVDDDDVEVVVLDGAGERGFCAGGDVRALRKHILADDLDEVAAFFREEYQLNFLIASYPKPVVVIADGVTMGGGLGLAGHASVRIVTERSRLAMPEVQIGFFADVGVRFLLSRAPGRTAEYVTLTGMSLTAADAIYVGFADHLLPTAGIEQFTQSLERHGSEAIALKAPRDNDHISNIAAAREWIDEAFDCGDVPSLARALDSTPAAAAAAQALRGASPTALAVSIVALRRARETEDLWQVLCEDFHLAMWFASTQTDMSEGIRARLVDREQTPQWKLPSPDDPRLSITVAEAFSFDARTITVAASSPPVPLPRKTTIA